MRLPRYPEYKDSGVEWLGEIPCHWSVCRLQDIAQVINGYPFDSKLFCEEGGHPLIRIRDLDAEETATRYAGDFVPAAAVETGDVLIGMDGEFNVGRWLGSEQALLNQRMCCVRPSRPALATFLRHALPAPLKSINDVTYSTTVKHLSSFQVKSIRLALPDDAELEQISRFLDRETGKIDALIAEQEKLLALLAEKRQATISHAVTRGLDPNAPMKDSGIPWLGPVPVHWEIARLKFVAMVQTGIAKGKDTSGKDTITVPYLRVANVQDGHLALDHIATIEIEPEQLDRYRLRPGDVLMNEGGDFDKLGRGALWNGEIENCIHQNHVFAVRPRGISPQWLNQITGSSYAQFFFMGRSKQSTNLASISSTNVMELPVLLPPHVEQVEILDFIQDESARIDALRAAGRQAVGLLQERRSALIAAAVTGQIDVRGAVEMEAA
ncbi:restriction endonuclease subunit S [Novilysobacter defluvii]|uniref:Type I restriction modification DNA specificity domain-containing protein n=1 Tax=Lysobacter defluvii IMMIB APB-9 = DSM 18482 TaxID=1385515 RepID=A0A0A0M9T9_9GAMM|nr:restriction endonuclease subunit S [Lysobacter defluvii]KGO99840.1 hypothetical protein N791_09965 [Lysobacter defluvii IMMIB APB-9 = DSM 18482]